MASIFAVLVGINDYPFKPLQGCINDVDAVEGYLKSNYPADRLNIRRLTDNGPIKPTRQGLIDAFDFFADAKPGDTCLFYYSGHGSFSPAPAGLDNNGELYVQSFVCLDSRGEGGKDLVDKEMAYLIWRRVRSHPDVHFVAITDCCHSGTITKGWIDDSRVTDRMASPGIGHVPATLEEYVGFSDSDFYTKGAAGYFAGQAKHIHLAASRDNQTSKELLIDGGGIRGAFTWSLLKTLNESSGQITYRKLLNKAKTLTEGLVSNQNPLVHFNGGLPASTNDTIFLSQEKTEKEAVPIPKFIEQASVPISISVAEQVPAAVKQLLIDAYPTARLESSILKNTTGQYIIRALNESEVFLSQPGNDGPVFEPEKVENAGDAQKFLRQCDKVGNWVRLRELEHPPKGLSYSLRLFRTTVDGAGRPGMLEEVQRKDGLIDLYSKWSVDHWEQPAFKVQITNTGDKDLYITSTSLGFDYRVAPQPFEEIQLNPGQSAGLRLVDEGTPRDVIPAQIDEEYKELGYQEITEYVKLFIGTEPIDVSAFEQTGLRLPSIKKKSFGLRNYKPEMDWTTETIGIRIFEPLGDSELAANQELRIGSIVIGPHAGLSGKVGLSSSALTARSADGVAGPHAANSNSLLEPFDLVSGTRGGSTSDVLELFDVKDPSVVTPDDPLVVELPAVTGMVMAIGYDEKTGLYYPLGGLDSDGKIRIETLPDQTNTDAAITQRSFLGSIKIYFQKIISDKLGIELGFQQRLAIPSVKDGKVKYESDVAIVSAAVAKASKILLFVHGIIGDTEGMAQCVDTDISGNTLKKRFDLVLTFDYENLETPIDETGIALQKCLKAVGLKEGHGKEFVIAAHSMGGLVSRWMIEKEGGHTFVSKLVMLGTPNNGTPWANVRDMADAFLTYAINGAAFLKPYLFILSGARKLFKGIDDNLQAMNAKSDFYKRLNTEKDPGIQYVIVAGDTSKIIVNYAETAKFLQRLFATVKKRGVYIALDAILFHKPNDIAVTDDSISLIPGADAWAVQPVVTPVACDHLNYFLTVTALGRIL